MSFTRHFLWYKNPCKTYPHAFLEAWQLCTKGPSGSLILGSFWAPRHSKCVWVILPLCCCLLVHLLVGLSIKYIWYTKLQTHVTVQVGWGKILSLLVRQVELPKRNSILQHREAMEMTMITLYWLRLTGRPYQFCNNCPQLLQIWKKNEYLIKTLYLSGEISYVGRVVKCFTV